MNRRPTVAAAIDPTPINNRNPLMAINAVHALWSRMKNKLVIPIASPRPLIGFSSAGVTPASSLIVTL
jgi:hypothetical protein